MASELPVLSCALDADGLEAQRDRYRRLAETVTDGRRHGDVLEVEFGDRLDRELLRETIAVERECCPFFRIEWDDAAQRLRVGVHDPAHAPAIGAIAAALDVAAE